MCKGYMIEASRGRGPSLKSEQKKIKSTLPHHRGGCRCVYSVQVRICLQTYGTSVYSGETDPGSALQHRQHRYLNMRRRTVRFTWKGRVLFFGFSSQNCPGVNIHRFPICEAQITIVPKNEGDASTGYRVQRKQSTTQKVRLVKSRWLTDQSRHLLSWRGDETRQWHFHPDNYGNLPSGRGSAVGFLHHGGKQHTMLHFLFFSHSLFFGFFFCWVVFRHFFVCVLYNLTHE
ncbi:hypothetical protein V8C37DRAFT_378406 [Trichoderma ceciliae]